MEIVYLVILIALLEYSAMILAVGATREKFGVLAPDLTGNLIWERLHRVQVNTAEQLVLFLPALLLFATIVSSGWAAALGCIFLVGRVVYAVTYVRDPKTRLPGAIMSSFTSYILVAGSLFGMVYQYF